MTEKTSNRIQTECSGVGRRGGKPNQGSTMWGATLPLDRRRATLYGCPSLGIALKGKQIIDQADVVSLQPECCGSLLEGLQAMTWRHSLQQKVCVGRNSNWNLQREEPKTGWCAVALIYIVAPDWAATGFRSEKKNFTK